MLQIFHLHLLPLHVLTMFPIPHWFNEPLSVLVTVGVPQLSVANRFSCNVGIFVVFITIDSNVGWANNFGSILSCTLTVTIQVLEVVWTLSYNFICNALYYVTQDTACVGVFIDVDLSPKIPERYHHRKLI